ncbi:MAG: box helicase domain protein [Hyphomicrobiales bacterium]|nr:box helicase domain protein [Hyphomicrobiales bacterium]
MARPATPAPLAAAAASVLDDLGRKNARAPLIYLAADDRRARSLQAICTALDPAHAFAHYPDWDVPPYDRLEPSPAVMGARMGVLRWLVDTKNAPHVVFTTGPAVLRRVPPRVIWPDAHREFRPGDTLDPDAARASLDALGYVEADVVTQAGEMAIRGHVIDIYPAAALLPCRIVFDDGRVEAIRSYDPLSQASESDSDLLLIDPAREDLAPDLPRESFFDYAAEARIVAEPGAQARIAAGFAQIEEGAAGQMPLNPAVAPERLFLTPEIWRELTDARRAPDWKWLPFEPTPLFAREKDAGRALDRFTAAELEAGRTILLTGADEALKALMRRLRRRAGAPIAYAEGWSDRPDSPGIVACEAPLDAGASLPTLNLTIIAAGDYLGSRAQAFAHEAASPAPLLTTDLRIGDVVVHRDHGLALLEGLEAVETPGEGQRDYLRLRYGDDARQMVPAQDIGLIWRYGADADAVTLDRLDRDSWAKRRDKVAADIARTAQSLVAMASERRARKAPRLQPAADLYERFAARFAYAPTPDQALAISAVLDDLESGAPMNRLVCGDVGYGKTEVALRAAAAAAFSGYQVAVLAPTTLLARQHMRAFRRRFAGLGVEIAELSRLVEPAQARQTKAALKKGEIDIVIGTHAVCGRGVSFRKLGLVIIDEEQKFGANHKQQARALSADAHVLTMTATPIPRTLQTSLVGLQDLSVIATPPHLRVPVRTIVAEFSEADIRDALLREKRRGGQSFFVTPRVADIEHLERQLANIAPELKIVVAHGQMKPADADESMLAFAEGRGDVLLATGIIESGLDVPAANTMLVHDAGRFGMAQLHQLRGRVGRGARRAYAYLFTQGGARSASATKRLQALATHDHLGAGFAISARDLDLRGAGDLLGDDQAGHVKLIGVGLYQEILAHALSVARGDAPAHEPPVPEFNLGLPARIPEAYAPEPDTRLSLYLQIDGIDDADAAQACASAIEDRFGPLPEDVLTLVAMARLRPLCKELGVRRLDAGPAGIAATFTREGLAQLDCAGRDWKFDGERIVSSHGSEDATERLALVEAFIEELADCRAEARATPPLQNVRAMSR